MVLDSCRPPTGDGLLVFRRTDDSDMDAEGIETDLPREWEERVNINLENNLRRDEVLNVFLEADRPYLERKHVQERVKGDFTRDPVLDRLDNLVNAGILEVDDTGAAKQFWISNEHSRWPIPNDVEVISNDNPDAITLSDFQDDEYFVRLLTGSALVIVGGVVMSGGIVFLPFVERWQLLRTIILGMSVVALLTTLVGFGLMLVAVFRAKLAEESNLVSKFLSIK